jgi:hypothetical protein
MLTPNTSLMLAGTDLHLLDEHEGAPGTLKAKPGRDLEGMRRSLTRLANRVMSLFL